MSDSNGEYMDELKNRPLAPTKVSCTIEGKLNSSGDLEILLERATSHGGPKLHREFVVLEDNPCVRDLLKAIQRLGAA